eukprot:GEZU01029302.1.p1 GENE.GEZU01029302.1~~GEZU01029302.1.p1  ORF type:complete len:447 (-),score=111.18 GEZU01029302.1:405-1745(-)
MKSATPFNLEHPDNKKQYSVALTPVAWNPDEGLSLSQMLQIAVQYSFFLQGNVMLFGRRIFFSDSVNPLDKASDLDLFTGLFQSFRKTPRGLRLNVDNANLVTLAGINVLDWIQLRADMSRFRDVAAALKDERFRRSLNSEIRGMQVESIYGMKRKYRIQGFEFKVNAATAKFEVVRDNKKATMTVKEYIEKTYPGIKVEDAWAPLLVVKKNGAGESNPTFLIPELCKIMPGQVRRSDLNANERSRMIDMTRKKPEETFKTIHDHVITIAKNEHLKRLGISIDTAEVETDAKVLPNQKIQYLKNMVEVNNGAWNLKDVIFFSTPPTAVPWSIVYYSRATPTQRVDDFIGNFVGVAKKHGLQLNPNPQRVDTAGDDPHNHWVAALRKCNVPAPAGAGAKPPPYFVLCALPDKGTDRYRASRRKQKRRRAFPRSVLSSTTRRHRIRAP